MSGRGRGIRLAALAFLVVLGAGVTLADEDEQAGARADRAAASAVGDPVIAAAGDIACDPANTNFNAGNGTSSNCRQKYTSDLLVGAGLSAVLLLGDNQYYCGGYNAFLQSYDPSWGRVKPITYPAVGNHEYLTSGGTDCNSANAGAAGHFTYFGATAGDPAEGYYSFDVGTWHMIMLNSNCGDAGGCSENTPQGQWLRADLAAHTNNCTLAFWHVPLFSSGGRASTTYRLFWDPLYAADADVVLNGHDHTYERFAPQRPDGTLDSARGIREFVVGTGGANHTSFVSSEANSEVRNDSTYGVLKLTLHPSSYEWQFVPEAGATFTDSGTGFCHGPIPDTTNPTAPTDLTASALGSNRVDLSWTAATDDVGVAGYRILRGGTQIGTSPTTSYSDTSVQPNTSYSYSVVAYDSANNLSPASNSASVTTGPPDLLLTFTPSADTYVQSDLPTSNFGAAASFTVDSSPVKNALLKFGVTGVGGGTIVSAKLRLYGVDPGGNGGTFSRVADSTWSEGAVTWNTAPAADPTPLGGLGAVAVNTWYELDVTPLVQGDGDVSVRATSSSSDGAQFSSKEGASGFAPQLLVTVAGGTSTPDTTAPTVPSNLSATAQGSTAINLSWTASTDNVGVAGYRIFRGGGQIGTTASTTFADTGVQPGTTYSYWVVAYDAAQNTSPQSNTATATTSSVQVLTFTATDDTTIAADFPAANYGSAVDLHIDNKPVKHFLLKFSVAGIGTRTVKSVKVRLRCLDSAPRGGDFRRVASTTWSEGTVTWGTAPAADATALATLGSVSAGVSYDVDVTGLVQADGVVSLRVSSTASNGADYASSESTTAPRPQLLVTVE